MTGDKLILGVPSKGRLMEQAADYFAGLGLPYAKTGHERGYRGAIPGLPDIEVAFLSAAEIARHLQLGRIHLGVTGEDLIREHIADADRRCDFLARLGFGRADVVVAVPECWIDVSTIADLEEAAALFTCEHGRRLRVATKYMNLARRFFAAKGLVSYRLVESLGATRRNARRADRRDHRRHYDDGDDAARQSPEDTEGRHDPEIGGLPDRLARCALLTADPRRRGSDP